MGEIRAPKLLGIIIPSFISGDTIAAWLLDNDGEGSPYDEASVDAELKKSRVIVDARPQLWSLASRASAGLFVLAFTLLLYPIVLGQHPIAALALFALCRSRT